MKKVALAFVFTLVLGAVALAHGDKKHVMGTVEKINPDSLVVKLKDGTSVMVKLATSTVFLEHTRGADKTVPDKPAQASDLAVGDLVVIHATPKEGGLEANEVKFSPPSSSKTAGSGSRAAHQ
ncbi:MAG TPA: DUF5666 domain-containing protein [Candidatus Acidoferrum sp.]|jgi:hypothetical protein|nr:DUF5666 domain-containing protein [Candidatus Acidoferrum sp.]